MREYLQVRTFALADALKPVTNDAFEAAVAELVQYARERPDFIRAEVARLRAAR